MDTGIIAHKEFFYKNSRMILEAAMRFELMNNGFCRPLL